MNTFQVKPIPHNLTFSVQPGEMILDAAIRQGINIPYVCRNGTCRTCMCLVREGESTQEYVSDCLISAKELDHGRRLICLASAKTDLVLERISPRDKLINKEA